MLIMWTLRWIWCQRLKDKIKKKNPTSLSFGKVSLYAWGAQETPCVWAVLFCFATLHVLLSRDRSGAGDRVGKWLLYNAITPLFFFFFKKKTNGWHLLISVCSFNHISLTPLLVSFCLGEDRWEAREKWCFFPPANSCGNRNLLSFSLL